MKSFIYMILSPFVMVFLVHIYVMHFNGERKHLNSESLKNDTITITVPFKCHNIYINPFSIQKNKWNKNEFTTSQNNGTR